MPDYLSYSLNDKTYSHVDVKPSYDYDLHNHLLSNESDTIVQIANRNSKIKMSILTLS